MFWQGVMDTQPRHPLCPVHVRGWFIDRRIVQGGGMKVYLAGPARSHVVQGCSALVAEPAGDAGRRCVEGARAVPGSMSSTNAKIAGERRSGRLAAAGAMTVHSRKGRARDSVLNCTAGATAVKSHGRMSCV